MYKRFIISLFIIFLSYNAYSQVLMQESYSGKEVEHVSISNMFGPIIVRPSSDKNIAITCTVIDGKMHPDVNLDWKVKGNFLIIYLRTPCSLPKEKISFSPLNPFSYQNWESDCAWGNMEEKKFATLKFEVFLPEGVNIYASTIMKGSIEMENIDNEIQASNVNGSIFLENVLNVKKAIAVNGQIDINYQGKPLCDAEIETINGDVSISTARAVDFEILFSSFSGELYTDFDEIEVQPYTQKKEQSEDGFRFSLNSGKQIKIGNGGASLIIKTFNGDVLIKKEKN